MNHQSKKRQDQFRKLFKGKTIKKVDAKSVNHLIFHFEDGTKSELEIEYMGHNIYGISKAI